MIPRSTPPRSAVQTPAPAASPAAAAAATKLPPDCCVVYVAGELEGSTARRGDEGRGFRPRTAVSSPTPNLATGRDSRV